MKLDKFVQMIRQKINNKGKIDFSNTQFFVAFFMTIGIILTALGAVISHGSLFEHIFWSDTLDTGMDFFHSIEYVKGRVPYEKWNTLYPPLANLFFLLLYNVIPATQSSNWENNFIDSIMARGTYRDLRTQQAPMILFILFIIITVLLLYKLVNGYFKHYKYVNVLTFCFIFNLGILWAYERGNIIVLSVILCIYFVQYRNSQDKIKSEIALICLALSAGLKIYPAFLGVLLIYEKQYKKAMRAVLYGVLSFILPCFVFKEGWRCIPLFFKILVTHSDIRTLNCDGFSADRIASSVTMIISKFLKLQINESLLVSVYSKLNIICCILILVAGFFLRKEWQRILTVCLAIIVYSVQGIYIVSFLLLPLLLFIREEKSIGTDNIVPVMALILATMIFPDYGIVFDEITPSIFRIQLAVVILFVYILKKVIRNVKKINTVENKSRIQENI